jgi:hypothetical protein
MTKLQAPKPKHQRSSNNQTIVNGTGRFGAWNLQLFRAARFPALARDNRREGLTIAA